MAVSKFDLYNVYLTRREAYILYLAKEENDPDILPLPLNANEEVLYDYCINSSASAAEAAAEAAEASATAAEASADLAEEWATKMDGKVDDDNYSAKYYVSNWEVPSEETEPEEEPTEEVTEPEG